MAPVETITTIQPHEITPMMAQKHREDHNFVNGGSNDRVAPNRSKVASPSVKYRHVAAVHSKIRTSCLSHDSEAAPSFLGFRNLMVIVLSK